MTGDEDQDPAGGEKNQNQKKAIRKKKNICLAKRENKLTAQYLHNLLCKKTLRKMKKIKPPYTNELIRKSHIPRFGTWMHINLFTMGDFLGDKTRNQVSNQFVFFAECAFWHDISLNEELLNVEEPRKKGENSGANSCGHLMEIALLSRHWQNLFGYLGSTTTATRSSPSICVWHTVMKYEQPMAVGVWQ